MVDWNWSKSLPGIDIDRDILAHMAFRPLMGQVREMDARIFRPEPIGLRSRLIDLDLTDRLAFDVDRNILFLNFEGLHVRSSKDVDAIREAVTLKVKRDRKASGGGCELQFVPPR